MDDALTKEEVYFWLKENESLTQQEVISSLSHLIALNRPAGAESFAQDTEPFLRLLADLDDEEFLVLALQGAKWKHPLRTPLLTRLDCAYWALKALRLWKVETAFPESCKDVAEDALINAIQLLACPLPFPFTIDSKWLSHSQKIQVYITHKVAEQINKSNNLLRDAPFSFHEVDYDALKDFPSPAVPFLPDPPPEPPHELEEYDSFIQGAENNVIAALASIESPPLLNAFFSTEN